MKKIYQHPEIVIVNVATAQMVCVSGFDSMIDNEGTDGSNALSRRGRDVWSERDDEDEEF